MNRKVLVIIPILSVLVGCGDITSSNNGPRNDELIANALNEVNFLNYAIQARQHNDKVGDFYTVATITPLDLSFKSKKTQLLYTTELSYYYFDKIDNYYDVYYKDKTTFNRSDLGHSFYGRYNLREKIEGIPTEQDIMDYYHVHNIKSLRADDFTYNTSLNGWYILKEDAAKHVIDNFFDLDGETYTLNKFNLQVSKNKVNSIVYELLGPDNVKLENELFYTYPIDYLQDQQFSLINDVTIIEKHIEKSKSIIKALSSDETSEEGDPSGQENNEDPILVDAHEVAFSIYNDANVFKNNRNTIESIAIYENFDYSEGATNTPLAEIRSEQGENISARTLTLTRKLTRNRRYLIRINIGSTPDGASDDYYDYSFFY